MSKLDAQRAMREAKYARRQAGAASRGSTPSARALTTPPVAPPASDTIAAAVEPAEADPAEAAAALAACGHKSMNGRACTREAGHSEKSHRYS